MRTSQGSTDPISFALVELELERAWKGDECGRQAPYAGVPRVIWLDDVVGARSCEIVAERLRGHTFVAIGVQHEVSTPRARQLFERAKAKWEQARRLQRRTDPANG